LFPDFIPLIVSGFYTANSTAEESCATDQCENAQSIANLPADVKTSPEGDDPDAKQRREFILQRLKELCTGTDRQLGELRNRYRLVPVIVKLLKEYQASHSFRYIVL
jgi:hypothetical protein